MDWLSDRSHALLAAVVTFLTGGGALRLLQAARGLLEARRQARMPPVLDAFREIYAVLHVLQREVGAGRALVLRASNGGGRPHPSKPLYVSVLFETSGQMSLVQEDWDKRPVDEQYVHLLCDVLADGMVELETADMDEGMLRDVYLQDGIVRSKVALIDQTPEQMTYLSVVYTRERAQDPDSKARRRAALRAAVERIRRVIDSIPR